MNLNEIQQTNTALRQRVLLERELNNQLAERVQLLRLQVDVLQLLIKAERLRCSEQGNPLPELRPPVAVSLQ